MASEYPFAEIERRFVVTLVERMPGGGYRVQVRIGLILDQPHFEDFRTGPDGTVHSCPGGFLQEFRDARVAGLPEAVERYTGVSR